VPARNYQLIAELLADAVRADPSGAARAALERAARAAGTENAVHADEDHSRPRDAAGVHAVLARHGYEPYDDEGVTRLRNCPFQRLAQTHRELVCRAEASAIAALGASGFEAEFNAGKHLSRDAAIRMALGEPAQVVAATPDDASVAPLAKREVDVARLVAEGLSNKQIGARLFISERTVDSHVRSILNKLGFNSRAQIASWMASSDQ
jgi:DNA-binding CsgD family transcriptional regulator